MAVRNSSDSELQQASLHDLCRTYAKSRQIGDPPANVKRELERRQYFTAAEWNQIESGAIEPGMRQLALIAAHGDPDTHSETKTADKLIQQFNYGSGINTPRTRVTLVNGVVERVSR